MPIVCVWPFLCFYSLLVALMSPYMRSVCIWSHKRTMQTTLIANLVCPAFRLPAKTIAIVLHDECTNLPIWMRWPDTHTQTHTISRNLMFCSNVEWCWTRWMCECILYIETYHHFMGQSGHKMEFGTARHRIAPHMQFHFNQNPFNIYEHIFFCLSSCSPFLRSSLSLSCLFEYAEIRAHFQQLSSCCQVNARWMHKHNR